MKNLKKILALVLVLAMAVSVVACSSGTPDSSSTPDTTPTSSSTPAEDSTPADDSNSGDAEPYTITISTTSGGGAEEAWTALADGYKKHHPEATIVVDLKPGEGYGDWVQTTTADHHKDPESNPVDIMVINQASNRQKGDVINWNEYMEETNPYDAQGRPWKETFDYERQGRSQEDGSFDHLDLFTVQVKWFYNVDIFKEVGVEAPKTWDDFVDVCEKLDAAGYQPISIEGDYRSFYEMRMGWIARLYEDQHSRTQIETYRAQPGDYCYDPDVDGSWEMDLTDPWNDTSAKVTINPVRQWAAWYNGEYSADSEGFRAQWNNFKKIFPKYAGGEAFFGCTDCMPAFYKGDAAIIISTGGTAIEFANNMKKLAAGESITMGEGTDAEEELQTETFTLGSFNLPTMTNESGKYGADEIFQAPVRTIEDVNGFLGAYSKNAEHDAQVVDFMMYLCSEEGMSLYLDAMFAAGGVVQGPCLVYGVEYPADIQAALGDGEMIGNAKFGTFARGLCDYPESTRAYYDLAIQCLRDEITVDEYCQKMKAQHDQYMLDAMPKSISVSDLEHPENEPTGTEG